MAIDLPIHYETMSVLEKTKMLNNKVLVEVFDNRGTTESNIKVPITIDNPFGPEDGIIYNKPDSITDFNIGNRVVFTKYKGTRIYVAEGNRQFLLMDAGHILAIIKD